MLAASDVCIESLGFLLSARVQIGLGNFGMVGTRGSPNARALHSESLSHDWAATSEGLQVGHAAAHRGGIVGGAGGERA